MKYSLRSLMTSLRDAAREPGGAIVLGIIGSGFAALHFLATIFVADTFRSKAIYLAGAVFWTLYALAFLRRFLAPAQNPPKD